MISALSFASVKSQIQFTSQEKKLVYVGVYDNNPVVYQDANGRETGFFPELLDVIAEYEDWQLLFVRDKWSSLLEKLGNNQIDLMTAIAYSENRSAYYSFNEEVLFTNWGKLYAGKGFEVENVMDLEGKTVAGVINDIYFSQPNGLKELLEKFSISCSFVEVESYQEIFELIQNNTIDAGIVSRLFGITHESLYTNSLYPTSIILNPVKLQFATGVNNTAGQYLLDRIDYHVRFMKNDTNSAYYQLFNQYIEGNLVTGDSQQFPEWALQVLLVVLLLLVFFLFLTVFLRVQVRRKTKELKRRNEQLREEKERADLANQAKSEFLAKVSHELRSPLHTISGYLKVLNETQLTPEQHRYLNIVNIASNNLTTIIEDLIDLSLIEKGQFRTQNQLFKSSTLIESLEPLGSRARNKGLVFQIQHSLPDVLLGDQTRLIQILTNLVDNAIKYTNSGQISVVMSYDRTNGFATFEITDTGVGIDQSSIERVFEPFHQEKGSKSTKEEGLGLGLSIVGRLVQNLGGTINLTSEVGKGTSFVIVMPLKMGAIKGKAPSRLEGSVNIQGDILVVDDFEENLNLISLFLKDTRVKVTTTSNGLEAVDLVKENPFDLVLMDIRMPEISGVKVMQLIRDNEQKYGQQKTIIIALTAYTNQVSEEKQLAGFDGLLEKPLKKESLLEELGRWLGQTDNTGMNP